MIKLSCLLKNINLITQVSLSNWTAIVAQAREQKLLGRIAFLAKQNDLFGVIPTQVQHHLNASLIVAQQQRINLERELYEIANSFKDKDCQPALLKGAAYAVNELKCSQGRIFSDLDLLVPLDKIRDAELFLRVKGWIHKDVTEYDEEYYRRWMHEIQPMIHIKRFTVIDLHHNLLPKTNKFSFAASKLHFKSHFIDANTSIDTLDNIDLFIHCSVHLFTESEFSSPLRDITDLSLMLEEFISREGQRYVDDVVARAQDLGVQQYVDLAIYLSSQYAFGYLSEQDTEYLKSITRECLNRLNHSAAIRILTLPSFQTLFELNATPSSAFTIKFHNFWLYLRGHNHRMPLRLLIPHLIRKAIQKEKSTDPVTANQDWVVNVKKDEGK